MAKTVIRQMRDADADAVLAIYQEGIDSGNATFEEAAPDWQSWCGRHLSACRLVAEQADEVVGWAALSPVSSRRVYQGVAEVSIYVASRAQGRGFGERLMRELIDASEDAGIWTLQAGIFPENAASIGLLRKCEFRTVGIRERLGRMQHGPFADRWRDVVLMERRSTRVGRD